MCKERPPRSWRRWMLKVTQGSEVRDYAAKSGVEAADAIQLGLAEKAHEFRNRKPSSAAP